ncbi:hypothetical protein O181_128128 [Austropuccinia psidii MF-1]|uniref:Uncharacterized protein n=1 Tax=Austropuccinia psidii MF-1 TaxID=1389203 RepID=A0A9Q3KVN1_9BASI|nr:hypothetical protein [Austropuccinia psidii MF-1]
MPSTRSGASYKPSSSSPKLHRCDYGSSQSDTKGQGQPEGLQQCTAAQRVPDPCRSVEKLHEFLPDFEKILGHPNTCKLLNGWNPLMEKKTMMILTAEWRKNNPPPPKQVPKTASIASRSSSNVKKWPQAQNKGKGKAPAPNPYRQGYRMPWKMYFRWPEP